MPRKKISTDAEIIDAIPDLGDNEQIVIEDTKRIRKERSKPPEPVFEPVSEPEIEVIEDEIESEDDGRFSETSIAAGIFRGDDEFARDQFCTVHIRRNPDSMNDHFVNPNSAVLNLPPLRNIDINTERADIEDIVRNMHGGGHYFFQIHYGNKFRYSWKASLGDTPEQRRAAAAPKEPQFQPAAPPLAPAEPVNPFDQFFDALEKQKRVKDLLFGDEKQKLEAEIERLRTEIASKSEPAPAPQSETLAILERAIAANNPTLQEKLFDIAFPPKDESSSHWIVELAKTFFDHKDELAGVAQMLLGGFVAPRQPANLEALMRQQPPGGAPPQPASSTFRRRAVPVPTTEPTGDIDVIDAEDATSDTGSPNAEESPNE